MSPQHNTSLISVRSENQSVSEVFCDKDSESRRSQFDQGTYPRLSQSSLQLSFQVIQLYTVIKL